MLNTIDEKEAQNLRWEVIGGGLALGIAMLILWYEVKTELWCAVS